MKFLPSTAIPKNQQGFTLIEILIGLALVIVIMGIMFSVFGNFAGSQDKARKARFLEQGRQVAQAIEAYYAEHGQWPSALSDLVSDYLKAVPQCENSSGSAIDAWDLQTSSDGGFGSSSSNDVYLRHVNTCADDNNVTSSMCTLINNDNAADYNCDSTNLYLRMLIKPDVS